MTNKSANISGQFPIDFFTPEILLSPLDVLNKMRERTPVIPVRSSAEQPVEYLVTSYELVDYVLTNPQLFSSDYQSILAGGSRIEPEVEAIRSQGFEEINSVLTADDQYHRRLRGLISTVFTPKYLQGMYEKLVRVVNERVDCVIAEGECDFLKDISTWLPTTALASMMGLDDSRNEEIQQWALAATRRFGGMGTLEERIADEKKILQAKIFLSNLVEERRKKPGDDLVSGLITARGEDGSALSELEIYAAIFILLVGATETTFNTLNLAIAYLLQHPEILEQVKNDKALVPLFIEEVLRYCTPVAGFWRIAREDIVLGGVDIKKGSIIMVRIDAANRDPSMFENPDLFDIHRKNNGRHVSFGRGPHTCIGLRLARQELGIAIPIILERLKNPEIIADKSDLRVIPAAHARGIRALHIRFDQPAG